MHWSDEAEMHDLGTDSNNLHLGPAARCHIDNRNLFIRGTVREGRLIGPLSICFASQREQSGQYDLHLTA